MSDKDTEPTPWWGTFSLEEGAGGEWHIGPSTLWVYRSSNDWRVMHRPSTDPVAADPMMQRSDVTVPVEEGTMSELLESEADDLVTHRYSVRRTSGRVALRPALADRPVVTRPEHPLSVLPDEAVTLYLSTPLWVRVELVESDRKSSHRMSDTWFGASTREGSLCYATRTAGRLRLDRLAGAPPPRPHPFKGAKYCDGASRIGAGTTACSVWDVQCGWLSVCLLRRDENHEESLNL